MSERPVTILEGIVGSTAYGLAGPDSDEDRLAVHLAPLRDVLGLHFTSGTIHRTDPDYTSHELAKFCTLALKANPTVLELLWLPDDLYRTRTNIGDELIGLRSAFLSTLAKGSYGGYAIQQAHRLVDRGGTFSSDLAKRTRKHARHCCRLVIQGTQLARLGEMRVRLDDVQIKACREAEELAVIDPAGFQAMVAEAVAELDAAFAESDLPAQPDTEQVNSWLVGVRMAGVR